jgi:hypothetical protein
MMDPLLAPVWATFNAFRSMGFPGRIIFLAIRGRSIRIELHDAEKIFSVKVCDIPEGTTINDVENDWKGMVEDIRTGKITQAELGVVWEEWQAKTDKVRMIVALLASGFDAGNYEEDLGGMLS